MQDIATLNTTVTHATAVRLLWLHNNIEKHYVINSEQITVKKTYTSELRRGPDPAPGRPGEGPREPGRTCARAVFCLENSMSAHKKCSNFFLRKDFCLKIFCWKAVDLQHPFLAKQTTSELSAKIQSPKRAPRGGNKKIITFPLQFNKKIVRPPKKVRKNKKFQTNFF